MSEGTLGPQFAGKRKIPVAEVGFKEPLKPRRDPTAMMEPEEGTRQPKGVKHVIPALTHGLVKPTTVDPTTTPLTATQTRLTPGSLRKAIENPTRQGRAGTGGPRDVPVIYRDPKGDHYVLDGHHRAAAHMLAGRQFNAVVLHSGHRKLAAQAQLGEAHVAARYSRDLDVARHVARQNGGVLFGRNPDPDAKAIRDDSWAENHPEWQPNAKRKEMGLPPRKRR